MPSSKNGMGGLSLSKAQTALTRFLRRTIIASLVVIGALWVQTRPAGIDVPHGNMRLEGVNLSGAEFTPQALPGTSGVDYIYPSASDIQFFAASGMNVIRVPFLWERMQPSENGPLSKTELAKMDECVALANARSVTVILDPHNYGSYKGRAVGVAGGWPNAMFANFWSQLAAHYAGNPRVVFGLMNEPSGAITPKSWSASAQAAVTGIRRVRANNLILVPSAGWEHPVNFVNINASAMLDIEDPADNFSYEVHQYLDFDGSGKHDDFLSVADSVATLREFTQWLEQHHRTAFLAEIGVTADPGALADLDAMLKFMHSHAPQWTGFTYWTAGDWYKPSDRFSIEPGKGTRDLKDSPQLKVLIGNLTRTKPAQPHR